jgi:hypothetical protein
MDTIDNAEVKWVGDKVEWMNAQEIVQTCAGKIQLDSQ